MSSSRFYYILAFAGGPRGPPLKFSGADTDAIVVREVRFELSAER